MDGLFEAIGKLLLVFKDPVNVILLMVCSGLGFANYKIVRFIMDRSEKDLEARVKLATAMEGLTAIIKEKIAK